MEEMSDLPTLSILFQRFAVALAIGLIIGLEREREKTGVFAGVRTFPLISLLGCAAALINDYFSSMMFPIGFAVLAAFSLRSYILTGSTAAPGITTEIASLLAFLYGGLVWWELQAFAAAAAVVTVLLLAAKQPLEDLTRRLGHRDIIAALQFGIITLIVLPLLPDRTYGPLQVLNPHTIWLMVVLIAAVNLIGYALVKMFGRTQGIALAGLLGGIGSSTALTLGFSRRSRLEAGLAPALALAIVIASTIMFARIQILATSISPAVGRNLTVPMAVLMAAGIVVCFALWYTQRRNDSMATGEVPSSNPLELWTAVQFGLLFGIILFLSKAAELYFGDAGIYLSSAIAGVTDVDAITLSLSNLAQSGTISAPVASQGVLIAAMANTAMKAGIALTLGAPGLRRHIVPSLGAILLIGLAMVFVAVLRAPL